jgi:hypothetical protein
VAEGSTKLNVGYCFPRGAFGVAVLLRMRDLFSRRELGDAIPCCSSFCRVSNALSEGLGHKAQQVIWPH